MSKTIKIPGRIESVATGKVVTGANFILDDTKGKKQNVINEETDAELLRLDHEKQGNLTFDQTPTEDSTNPVTSGGVYAADQLLSQAIEAILLLIPSAASELNKLVDLATMNSSISTATASFKGTYNLVSDLHLTVSATHAQIAAALDALSLDADNNDYAFVQVPNTDTAPTDIAKTERYKFNGENWAYEYDLNNSGFTTAQWNAINSGITTLLVAKLLALPTNEALTLALAGKQDNLTFDNAPTAGSNNPVKSRGIYTRNNEIVALINALDVAKQNVLTFDTTPTNGSTNPVTSNGVYLAIQLVQTAVVALDGRMGTAETKISTAEGNIVNLQAAYAALTQSDIVVVSGALPSSGQQQNIIYRQPDQDHTPPQFYSDYMWNGSAWVLMASYNNAIDPRPKKGSQNLVTSGGVFDNMGALDVSELNATENPHKLKPYATLDAALADISSDYQKGGMSIKFVRTYDNKYVQYRCIADEFTTDTTQWAIADEGVYVENPEFVYVKTDKEGKILWAIRTDGDVFYGAGVPSQIVNYINEKIAELSLDEYEDIVAFLSGLEEGDKTLQMLLNEKVDKEEGKSLINAEYASSQSAIENPEFIEVTTDSEDKILEGIQQDGAKVICGDLNVGGSTSINGNTKILGSMEVSGVSYKVVENPEYIAAWIDAEEKVIFGFKVDGKTFVGDADFFNAIKNNAEAIEEINSVLTDTIGVDNIDWNALTSITAIENPEYISVEIDTEDRILSGRKPDGTKVENLPIETPSVTIDSFADPEERIELNTDTEKRVLSYRDKNGVLHENVGIETPTIEAKITNVETVNANEINLPSEGLTELGQALINNGFYAMGFNDFSNTKNVELPEPKHYGIINLIISSLPIEDEDVSKGYVEYYDFSGNYFKKKCKIEPQGQSSKDFARTGGKGNYTLKIDDAIKSKVKFGSWVPQKSWHLKGCAKDVTRGYLSTSYKWAYKMMESLDASPIRNLTDDASITTTQATGDRLTDWPTDARCLPDGFPVEVYINGEYWGLYALQLQKKSDNYAMDEEDYTSLIIDAELLMNNDAQGLSVGGFWSGDIWWNRFEVRNPKPLICMDGTEYDGDNPKELMDEYSRILIIDSIPSPISQDYNGCVINLTVGGTSHSITISKTDTLEDIKTKLLNEDYSPIICVNSNTQGGYVKFLNNPLKNENDEYYPKPVVTVEVSAISPGTKKVSLSVSSDFDKNNLDQVNSTITKRVIEGFSTKYLAIQTLIDNNDLVGAKTLFSETFDVNACMLVYIFNCLTSNFDSVNKNTLWATWNNGKIVPLLWDLDSIYGENWTGVKAQVPSASMWTFKYARSEWPLGQLWTLYETELKAAYASLRNNGVISIDTWRDAFINKWVNRIGEDAYKRDIKKWKETPSYRKNYTNTSYWTENNTTTSPGTIQEWNNQTAYSIGDKVTLRLYDSVNSWMVYTAVAASDSSNPQCPVTKFYTGFPKVGGYYNSYKRIEKWLEEQIRLCDIKMLGHEYQEPETVMMRGSMNLNAIPKFDEEGYLVDSKRTADNMVMVDDRILGDVGEVVELVKTKNYKDFTLYSTANPEYIINCMNMYIYDSLPEHSQYVYVYGYLHNKYTIDGTVYEIIDGHTVVFETPETYMNLISAVNEIDNLGPNGTSSEKKFVRARVGDILDEDRIVVSGSRIQADDIQLKD